MKELHSEIEIDASAERVWDILTDFASYPQWNPFIRRIGGELEVGERLEVRLQPPDSRGYNYAAHGPTRRAQPPDAVGRPPVCSGDLRRGALLCHPPAGRGPSSVRAARSVQGDARSPVVSEPGHQHAAWVRGDERGSQRASRGTSREYRPPNLREPPRMIPARINGS
jgi:hypothetical protein